MRKFNDLLEKYDLKPLRYKMIGKITIIDTDKGSFVLKPKLRNDNTKIYKYLDSRSFDYYPKIYSDDNDDYVLSEYIKEIEQPKEQKIEDLIYIVSLLHNKTTHYVEASMDDYKKIYEDVLNNVEYLQEYYSDIMDIIESHVFMSPSEYLFARNCSKIFGALNFCTDKIKYWFDLVKDKKKQRFVVLHNNLDLSHFIKNKDSYLINWDKAHIDVPIFDLYKLYKRHALDFNFESLFRTYEKNYPLLEEEKTLFFVLISLPPKIEFTGDELLLCMQISKMIDYMYKTENLLSPYYAKD